MTHAPRCVCDACWPTRLREMRALIEAAARRLGEQMLRRARSVSLPDGLDWLATGRWSDEPPKLTRTQKTRPSHLRSTPLKRPDLAGPFSERSQRIIAELAKGKPTRQVALELGIPQPNVRVVRLRAERRGLLAPQVVDPPPFSARRRSRRAPPRNRRRRALIEIAATARDRAAELRAIADRDRAEWRATAAANPDRPVEPDRLEMGAVNHA